MKCYCGKYIEKGTMCEECSTQLLKDKIDEQIKLGLTQLTVLAGRTLAKETSDIIIDAIYDNKHITDIDIHGRGRYITRAVDILEILKREFNVDSNNIETNTKNLLNSNKENTKISEIHINIRLS